MTTGKATFVAFRGTSGPADFYTLDAVIPKAVELRLNDAGALGGAARDDLYRLYLSWYGRALESKAREKREDGRNPSPALTARAIQPP